MPASPEPNGLFVTGTGTGVGKSIVAASIIAALSASGHRVAAFKPVVTGLDEPDPMWPLDHVLLSAATGWQTPERVTPYTFGPAASPHLAAELDDMRIEPTILRGAYQRSSEGADLIVCEGVGGLMVPLSTAPPYSVLDLIKQFALPVVVVAHPELGTISDTRLTVDRLRAERIPVRGVVLSPWPAKPSRIHDSNRKTIEQLCEIEVHVLAATTPGALAEAGASLPVERWVGSQ
ncbi:MAG TPA: dethiobiotin synthase [Solirubrobacterales bacterium]|nr:dethiobiotin synthase [Solirubrobacterales bacterium]